MKIVSKLLLALAVVASIPTYAFASATGPVEKGGAEAAQVASTAGPVSEGEIKKIDKDAGKLTIKHGPLTNLDMPGMTMVFRVKDTAMLDQVKAGDKVKLTVEKINGALTVTALEAAK